MLEAESARCDKLRAFGTKRAAEYGTPLHFSHGCVIRTRVVACQRRSQVRTGTRGTPDKGSGGRRLTDLLNSPVSNSVFRFATVSGQNIHWFLKRNCSVTPSAARLAVYASLCVVSLGIGDGASGCMAAPRSCCRSPGSNCCRRGVSRCMAYAQACRPTGETHHLVAGSVWLVVATRERRELSSVHGISFRTGCGSSRGTGDRSLIELSGQGRVGQRWDAMCGRS